MILPKFQEFLYTKALKPILFLFKPDTMHIGFNKIGSFLGKYKFTKKLTRSLFHYSNPFLKQKLFGFQFSNPVGLSAGFDKDILLTSIMDDVGCGFTEVGSITYKPYGGNPKPWVHRLKQSEGLIVYYGLKNKGIDYSVSQLKKTSKSKIPIIVSVAKTNCKSTADTKIGIEDYISSLQKLQKEGVGDIYDINISCPNAFGGENYTDPERLDLLLQEVQKLKIQKPIFIKMPVDKTRPEFKKIVDITLKYKVTGLIIANLIKNRKGIKEAKEIEHIPGGISGKPTTEKSNQLIAETYKYAGDKLLIIGVGGIFSAQDAYDKIKSGASLVQLITGMIFKGPQLIGQINQGLVKLAHADGYKHISEAIGANHNPKS